MRTMATHYLAYGHRVIDTAKAIGAGSVSFGLFEALTDAQKKALWFWTVDGAKNPDDAGGVEQGRDAHS